MSTPSSADELDELEAQIDAWLAVQLEANPVVAAVERDRESGERRWFVRVTGEEKDVFTIWFTLRQRTLHYETYVMPAPEENHAAFYEHVLRRNHALNGAAFCIGDEDAIFLRGQLALHALDDDLNAGRRPRHLADDADRADQAQVRGLWVVFLRALERQEREPTPQVRRVSLTVVASNKCLSRATPMRGPRNALDRHLSLVWSV